MRRIVLGGVLVLAVLGVIAPSCQPAEPAMTITAKVYDEYGETPPPLPTCGYVYTVEGTVTPSTATKKVVLQQRSGGKWVDLLGWGDPDSIYHDPASARTANVRSGGTYKIYWLIDWISTAKSLRVRSNGGGAVSPTFYLKPVAYDGLCG